MSQLDISISFYHLLGLMVCFYLLTHYVVFILINFFYNHNLSFLEVDNFSLYSSLNNDFIINNILNF